MGTVNELPLPNPVMDIALPVTVADHAFQESVAEYVWMKVPDDVINGSWSTILIKGSSLRSPPARISRTEKRDKHFNWHRPTTTIIDDGKILQINCFPGRDYVLHYAIIVASYLSIFRKVSIPVLYEYPSVSQSISVFEKSNLADMGQVDVVVVGYVHFLNRFLKSTWQFGKNADSLFAWQTLQTHEGKQVAFLGCLSSFWGELSGHLVRALRKLNDVKCVLYIGKAGALRGMHAPNHWIATGNQSYVDGRVVTWMNALKDHLNVSSVIAEGVHVTVPTPLLETKEWLEKWKNSASWVDCEVGRMAEACNEANLLFSYLHIVSDNLARDFPYNLLNERLEVVKKHRQRLFDEIQNVLGSFFSEATSLPTNTFALEER